MPYQNTSVSLSEHFTTFIAGQVRDGRYGSASDVIRAGLRLLEEREKHLDALNAAIEEGLASGPPVSFDPEEFIARMRKKYGHDG